MSKKKDKFLILKKNRGEPKSSPLFLNYINANFCFSLAIEVINHFRKTSN